MFKFFGAFLATLAFAFSSAASAQQAALPPLIKIVVPFAPGASTDIIARALALRLAAKLGTNVVVENRTGANGLIGTGAVVNGPRDGSSLVVVSSSLITVAATKPDMPFDVTKDLIPLAVLGEGPLLVAVNASTNIRTPADLVAAARAKPGGLTHGTGGAGTIAHLAQELLADAAKMEMRHIPYRGAALAMVDLQAGTLDMVIATRSSFSAALAAGRVRLVAATTARPTAAFADLPVMASVAPGYTADIWVGLWAPAGTPAAVVERLNSVVNELTSAPDYNEVLKADGNVAVNLTPAEISARVRSDYAKWKKIATEKKIVID